MDKIALSAQDLLEDSIELGIRILESGFEPTMIIAIWRGGTPVGMALQETLSYCGIESDHIAIRTSSYTGVDQRGHVAVHGLNYIVKKICYDDRVLIVDDVFDTGNTIKAVIEELRARARGNTPEDIRVAVPHRAWRQVAGQVGLRLAVPPLSRYWKRSFSRPCADARRFCACNT